MKMIQQKMKGAACLIIIQLLIFTNTLAESKTAAEEEEFDDSNLPVVNLHQGEEITIADYEACQANKKKCMITCNAITNSTYQYTCFSKCPICPVPVQVNQAIDNVDDDFEGSGASFPEEATKQETCCTVVTPGKKRIRLCGKHCKAPVMRAIPKITCSGSDETTCKTEIRYVPYVKKKRQQRKTNLACFYIPSWPFINCPKKELSAVECPTQCLQLQYVFILRYGVPSGCKACFDSFKDPLSPAQNKWVLESSKCRSNKEGQLLEDCENEANIDAEKKLNSETGDFSFLSTEKPAPESSENEAAALFTGSYERIPRNTFKRSKYSLRNKPIP